MIYVRVELWRHGDPEQRTLLGEARIANVSRRGEQSTSGDYRAKVRGKAGRLIADVGVEGFPRKRLLAWDLLYRVLREAVGTRNGR